MQQLQCYESVVVSYFKNYYRAMPRTLRTNFFILTLNQKSEAYSTWQFAAKIQNRNYITALLTVGIEFSCIQRRKYFGDSVSCRKCILCDRDATGALGPRIHTSGLDLCLCICPLPKMHTKQAKKIKFCKHIGFDVTS